MNRDLKTVLNEIMDIGGTATEYNLASPSAQTSDGAVLQVSRRIKEAIKHDLIRPLPSYRPIDKARRRQLQFYTLTAKGAHVAERADEYKYKKPRAIAEIEHDSGVRDIALSIKRAWPEAKLELEKPLRTILNTDKGHCDLYAEINGLKLIIEYERKNDISKVYAGKVLKYSQLKYEPNMRVCIIFNTLSVDPFIRQQSLREFERPEIEKKHYGNYLYLKDLEKSRLFGNLKDIDRRKLKASAKWYEEHERVLEMKKKFLNLMEKMKSHENDKFFRLTRWDNYYKLNEAVFFMPDGNKVKLIN
jgi:hypothetical protein